MRADTIAEPQRGELKTALKEYTADRVALLSREGRDQIEPLLAKVSDLHERMWRSAIKATQARKTAQRSSMRRRQFIAGVASAAAWPVVQPPQPAYRRQPVAFVQQPGIVLGGVDGLGVTPKVGGTPVATLAPSRKKFQV
jgi:hypothetical protein